MKTRLAVGFLLTGLLGCGPGQPVEVTAIQLGRVRNADKSIGSQVFDFKPTETILASVVTSGEADDAVVRARWSVRGVTVGDAEQRISHKDGGITPFELRSSGGFPPGTYTLEILLNDVPAGEREFKVR
ncbi:MAG: hypothetical protein AB7I50_21030 [Vicinamibacterales bacterium]